MAPKLKGKSATLARVRNNQRRSRARKREYIAELERKVHEYEANGAPTRNIIPHDTILRLEDENRKLRELLHLAGVEQTLVNTHLNYNGSASEVADSDNRMQTSPEIALDDLSTDLVPTADRVSIPDPSGDLLAASFLRISRDELGLFDPVQAMPSFDLSPASQSPAGPSFPFTYDSSLSPLPSSPFSTAHALCPAGSSFPTTSQSDSGTTLCSVAYQLVCQHNKRGIDMMEIGIRLWNGFVKGDGVAGCKVENKLLFSVLEYISD